MQVSLIFGLVGRLARDSCEMLGQDRERERELDQPVCRTKTFQMNWWTETSGFHFIKCSTSRPSTIYFIFTCKYKLVVI